MAHLDAHQTVALDIFRSPKSTPIHEQSAICLQGLFASLLLAVEADAAARGHRDGPVVEGIIEVWQSLIWPF
jgi:hypothetical protein